MYSVTRFSTLFFKKPTWPKMNSFAKKYYFPKIFAKTCVNDYADTVSAESTNTPPQCQRGQQLRGPDTVSALSMTTRT